MDDFPSEIFIDEAKHKFCWIYWEHDGPNSTALLYYLDTPDSLGLVPDHKFTVKGDLHAFNGLMRPCGWQVYHLEADQVSYRSYLIRLPALAAGFEHCVLSFVFTIGKDELNRPLQQSSVFFLGESNNKFIGPDGMWKMTYDQIAAHLDSDRWAFAHEEDYPWFNPTSNHRWRLRFYQRPL